MYWYRKLTTSAKGGQGGTVAWQLTNDAIPDESEGELHGVTDGGVKECFLTVVRVNDIMHWIGNATSNYSNNTNDMLHEEQQQ